MQTQQEYDYIILGAGLSGLMLACRLADDDYFNSKKILILDSSKKNKNDRTWCFWKTGLGYWDTLVSKKWSHIIFKSNKFSEKIELAPYAYNKIEGKDFYAYCFEKLSSATNITFKTERVIQFNETDKGVALLTDAGEYRAKKVFTSILPKERLKKQKHSQVLQQHFIGWFIKTEQPVFNAEAATFMDFSIPQRGNTRFMYVLPTSPNEALVEYTLFSEHLLNDEEYEAAIKDYLAESGIEKYSIVQTEKGCIPMTDYPFERHNTKNIMHIGTAGGWTRGSTGFTFNYSDKLSQKLIEFLKAETDLSKFKLNDRFRWYDKLFLDVLYRRNDLGSGLFAAMFQNNKIDLIFRFLDAESTIAEDLKLIWSLPKKEFVKAFFIKGIK